MAQMHSGTDGDYQRTGVWLSATSTKLRPTRAFCEQAAAAAGGEGGEAWQDARPPRASMMMMGGLAGQVAPARPRYHGSLKDVAGNNELYSSLGPYYFS